MCGVAGFFSTKHVASDRIDRMTQAIYHRGPDAKGIWKSSDSHVGLGHRRLAILDLSERGIQPLYSQDRKHVFVYNGEIYNFPEIRKELETLGHEFDSTADTEVVFKALLQWGEAAVQKFNGMWAFIWVDLEKRRLFASRDYAGIKPLYYSWDGETLLIGSEVKALLASGLLKAAVDPEGLNEYFTFQNIISNRTLFKGVRMLRQGHNLTVDLSKATLQETKFWDFDFTPDSSMTESRAIEAFRHEFSEAVGRHMISDVPVGATISGGMDSSSIVYEATKRLPKLHTFTGWFDNSTSLAGDRSFSEREDARLVSDAFKTVHHERLISWQDQMMALPDLVWHLEDPKVAMCYTFYTISHLVSQQVTVNLSGTGGDEIFAGYPWRYSLIERSKSHEEFNKTLFDYWSRVVKQDDKSKFFTAGARAQMSADTPWVEFQAITERAKHLSPVNRSMYFEAKTFLHGMLMVEDKMGMAFSIETRFPFLDKNLIHLAQSIPDDLKYRDGVGKWIFRRAFEGVLPSQITNKKKQGFTPPDLTYYRRELREWIESMLLGRRTMCHEWIEPAAIRAIIDRHDKGEDMRMQIWSLLFFEQWCRTFLYSK
ncbi:asparagine synthase (glutamine-hydrolyzing) [soil metagenome]